MYDSTSKSEFTVVLVITGHNRAKNKKVYITPEKMVQRPQNYGT